MIGQLVPMMQGVGYATMTIVFWLGKLVIQNMHHLKTCLSLLSLYRKFETYTPRNETALSRSQFLCSCVCEWFIYSNNWFSADGLWEYIDRSQIHECEYWETEQYNSVLEVTRPRSVISGNTWIGTRHLYWFLIGPSFAVFSEKFDNINYASNFSKQFSF